MTQQRSADQWPMHVTAIAPWFGSKRTLAPRIIAEVHGAGEGLPAWRAWWQAGADLQAMPASGIAAYWELFGGSLAVLLNSPPVRMETVNDLHGDVINLARVLQREATAQDLYTRLSRTMMCEQLQREAAQRYRARGNVPAGDGPDVERAEDYMLCAWLGRNGVQGTQSYNQGFCVRYTNNGGHPAKRWTSAVESIPAWHQRLRNVTVLSRDAFEVLAQIEDAPQTGIYLDPPYVSKGATYVHDFAESDHERLAALARRFENARVVVSYYDHPLVRELYADWWLVECPTTKAMVSSALRGKGKSTQAPEVLLINQLSVTDLKAKKAGDGMDPAWVSTVTRALQRSLAESTARPRKDAHQRLFMEELA